MMSSVAKHKLMLNYTAVRDFIVEVRKKGVSFKVTVNFKS